MSPTNSNRLPLIGLTGLFGVAITGCSSTAGDSGPLECPEGLTLNQLGYCVDALPAEETETSTTHPEPPDWTETDCDSHYAQLCYDGDVYWYDSCGGREDRADNCSSTEECVQVGQLDAECQAEDVPCVPNDSKTCVGDDVYWVDSCGVTGSVQSTCNEGCLESSGDATCSDVEFRCWDSDDTCYEFSQILSLDIDCEVRALGDEPIELESFEIWARYSTDQSDIEEWDDDDWSGSLQLNPGTWTDVPDTFNVDLNNNLGDEELELEGSLTVSLGSDSQVLQSLDAESSETVQVLDSWICW